MPDTVDALVIDLLEWIGPQARPYVEVIDAWRTSCPRLPVWEEANARGYIIREYLAGTGALISVSPKGLALLDEHRHVLRGRDAAYLAVNKDAAPVTLEVRLHK
jgi:hypothetical protein